MTILDKHKLAGYVMEDYEKKFGRRISPIKLQKGMYFLFAFWARFSQQFEEDGSLLSEHGSNVELSKDLFEANFEAWKYGPVDRELYGMYNENRIVKCNSSIVFENVDPTVKEFVDDLLNQIYDVSDFGLVNLSHEDNCWESVYKRYPSGTGSINKESIIDEYRTEKH